MRVGRAHHEAFAATGGEHSEWPLWYAEHLRDELAGLLGLELTVSETVHLMFLAEGWRQEQPGDESWAAAYADFFLHHFGSERD